MGQLVLIWGFPFYLIVLEMLFRGVSGLNVSSFVGPAIATAGLSFMLPMTKPKEYNDVVSAALLQTIEANGGIVVNIKDQRLIPFIWLAILFGFLVWFWASNVSVSKPNATIIFVPSHVAIGLINYCIAALIAILKERV